VTGSHFLDGKKI